MTLATAAPPSLIVSSGRNAPPNGIAVEELSICPAEDLNSDEEGEPPSPTAAQRH